MHTTYEKLCKEICVKNLTLPMLMNFSLHNGSLNITSFQTLKIQPKSVPIPFQDFYPVLASVAENKQCICKRIKRKTLLHQYHQPIDEFSHIRISAAQIYRFIVPSYHSDFNTLQISFRSSVSIPLFTVILQSLTSITSVPFKGCFCPGASCTHP